MTACPYCYSSHIEVAQSHSTCLACFRQWFHAGDNKSTFEPSPTTATTKLTLPTDSKERKSYPLYRGCLSYFPAALAGVSKISKDGNDKHNPGQEMHHARGKSADHADCILRHLTDAMDLLAAHRRGTANAQTVLTELSQLAWRALALSQELHEELAGMPLAPGAKNDRA